MGIGMGLAVAIFFVLYNNYKKPFLFRKEEHINSNEIRLELAEDVTFINKASILRTLTALPEGSTVVIDASKTINIDPDVIEIIEDFKTNAKYKGINLKIIELESVLLPSPTEEVENALANNILKKKTPSNFIK